MIKVYNNDQLMIMFSVYLVKSCEKIVVLF